MASTPQNVGIIPATSPWIMPDGLPSQSFLQMIQRIVQQIGGGQGPVQNLAATNAELGALQGQVNSLQTTVNSLQQPQVTAAQFAQLEAQVQAAQAQANSWQFAGGQLPATKTNDNAAAGKLGEFLSSNVASGSAISLTTGTAANVTSLSLTPGDWDCRGVVAFPISVGASNLEGWISTTSATLPTDSNSGARNVIAATSAILANSVLPTGTIRMSLAATTTIYLSVYAAFASGTVSAYGFLAARRAR